MPHVLKPDRVRQHSDEVKEFAHQIALAAALKANSEFNDVSSKNIAYLGNKWQGVLMHMRKQCRIAYKENTEGLIVLARRANVFAHHYEAALNLKTIELGRSIDQTDAKLTTAAECEKFYPCGILAGQYYGLVYRENLLLVGTKLNDFPETVDVLMALCLDQITSAAQYLPADSGKAMDLLGDSFNAHFFATELETQIRTEISHRKALPILINKAKKDAVSEKASKNAKLKQERDPAAKAIQESKVSVYKLWEKLPDGEKKYGYKADFAKKMLQTFENLKSQKVIEGWCTNWEKGKKIPVC